jgi:hypothetical protein
MTRLRTFRFSTALAGLIAIAVASLAAQSNQELVRRLAENNEALKTYSWTTRVQVTEKGQKTVSMYKMRYDIDGKLQATPMTSESKAPEQIEAGLRRLARLALAYTQPGAHQFSKFLSTAEVWAGRGNTAGTTRIEGSGLHVAGDRVVITLGKERAERMQVNTTIDGDPFSLVAEFRGLPSDGPTYAARTTVRVPGDQLDIVIENFDYTASGEGAPVASVTLPAGTKIAVRTTQPISTKHNKTGETFTAIIDQDVSVGGRRVIPNGSRATGRLAEVKPAGKSAGGRVSLVLTTIELEKGPLVVQTEPIVLEAKGQGKRDAGRVVGGSAIGAIVGGIAGGGSGAAIGAAVGGGAGTAAAVATKGNQIELEAEHEAVFALAAPAQLTGRALGSN